MELKYFKTKFWGDCYVPNDDFMNVVSIDKHDICVMAFDDSNLSGLYKPLNVSKKDYQELKGGAFDKDREKVIGLLKKIHDENELVLNSGMLSIKKDDDPLFDGYYNKMHEAYEKRKPILE